MLEGRRKGATPDSAGAGGERRKLFGVPRGKLLAAGEEAGSARSDVQAVTGPRLGPGHGGPGWQGAWGAVCPRTTTPLPLPLSHGAEGCDLARGTSPVRVPARCIP